MRVPKTFYDKGFVVRFTVKHKQIFHNIYKWSKDGVNLGKITTGKYNNEDPKDLITLEIKSCEEI